MTQPNQSELDGLWSLIDDHFDTALLSDEDTEAIEAYIAANYTPKTKLKALIKASKKLNLEFHGRPDCKNCSLQEQLAELIKDNKL